MLDLLVFALDENRPTVGGPPDGAPQFQKVWRNVALLAGLERAKRDDIVFKHALSPAGDIGKELAIWRPCRRGVRSDKALGSLLWLRHYSSCCRIEFCCVNICCADLKTVVERTGPRKPKGDRWPYVLLQQFRRALRFPIRHWLE